MKKSNITTGYVAFVKGDSTKALNNYWSGGAQTGTNKQTITDDIDKITIASIDQLEMMIGWFNQTHKNKIEFEIKEVKFTISKELELL
jgi:hypothetical protein